MRNINKFFKTNLLLFTIILLGLSVRLIGVNWDQGYHLHPDERMITMVANRIHLPQTDDEWQLLLTPDSPLNPKFFAYGSMPIYLLSVSGAIMSNFDPLFGTYEKINLIGRVLSAIFDIGSLIFIFLIAKRLFNLTVAYLTALFYSISVLPIQLSHFYAVDTPLTFFITLTLYLILLFYHQPSIKKIVFIGITYGVALATKTSALLLIIPVAISFLMLLPKLKVKKTLLMSLFFLTGFFYTFIILEPYALIDLPTFIRNNQEQQAMTKSAFTFPYTLQYVNKIHIVHELKNIYFWGLGPVLATFSFAGLMYLLFQVATNRSFGSRNYLFILLGYFLVYFLTVSNFAVGFIRYLLPLYPLLCLSAAVLIWKIWQIISPQINRSLFYLLNIVFLGLILLWPISFLSIYQRPNPRITATEWINQNIPFGSTIATEHWDDGLPIATQSLYKVTELPMYEPDTPQKWQYINQILDNTDYIIIASHRLYRPLMDLTNCQDLPTDRCYTQSAKYYHKLFNNQLGYRKIVEFTNFPTIPYTKTQINDFDSDETFTVYDQPKIMIFKKQ